MAQTAVTAALDDATYDYDQSENTMLYGNRRRIDMVTGRLERLEAEIASLKTLVTANKEASMATQKQVRYLLDQAKGYRGIGQRFLDVYRRDVLQDNSARCSAAIAAGNAAAHAGDAVSDASLYEAGDRHDVSLMFKIYGLCPYQVLELCKCYN